MCVVRYKEHRDLTSKLYKDMMHICLNVSVFQMDYQLEIAETETASLVAPNTSQEDKFESSNASFCDAGGVGTFQFRLPILWILRLIKL